MSNLNNLLILFGSIRREEKRRHKVKARTLAVYFYISTPCSIITIIVNNLKTL